MKAFVCLAISCLLVGLLYVYVRQQLEMQSTQILQLTGLIRTMAVDLVPEKKKEDPVEVAKLGPERIDVSDDSESDDTDSEQSSTEEVEVDVEPEIVNFIIDRPEEIACPEVVEVSLLEETILEPPRQIVLETNYESWSMKDLKEKISKMGGPNLKTKKLMLEFLEKSVQ